MELKWKKDLADDSLELLAKEALSQIDKNRYDLEIKEDGITDILKFGSNGVQGVQTRLKRKDRFESK